MDETKLFQPRTRRRISSLPETSLTEIITSVERIRHTSSVAELPRNFRTGKRHSLDSPYSSSRHYLIEESEFPFNDGFKFHPKPREEEKATAEETNSDLRTRLARFPALPTSPVTCNISPFEKAASLNRIHSGKDYERGETGLTSSMEKPWVNEEVTDASSSLTGTKSSLPRIKRAVNDSRRLSLPISKENTTELHTTAFLSRVNLVEGRESQTEVAHPLPSLVCAGFINPPSKQSDKLTFDETDNPAKLFPRDKGSFDCNRANLISHPADGKSDESVEETDKAQALRTHVEDAAVDFNEVETKAVMLVEWLWDQSNVNS